MQNCNANLHGSGLRGFVWYSAKAGLPTGGIIQGNAVYGGPGSFEGFALDSAAQVIPDTDNGAFYLGANALMQ